MVYDDFAYLFIQIIINIYTCLHLTPYAIYILYTHAHTIYTYTYYMPMPILYTHIHTIYPCPYYIHIYILYIDIRAFSLRRRGWSGGGWSGTGCVC